MIVLGTVLLNATTARFISKITGVFLKKSEGILIVGASEASRVIAKYFNEIGKQVVLIDTNKGNIDKANKLGIEALNVDIYSDELVDNIELNNIGYLIALTGNTDINKYAIEKFKNQFGENGAYRISTQNEIHENEASLKNEIFSCTNDFLSLSEAARTNPTIHELKVETEEEYIKFINKFKNDDKVIPLFIKSSKNQLNIISENNNNIDTHSTIVYLGRKINDE